MFNYKKIKQLEEKIKNLEWKLQVERNMNKSMWDILKQRRTVYKGIEDWEQPLTNLNNQTN